MRVIKRLVNQMKDELCSAKDYTESYLECKVKGNSSRAQRYKEMALDELKHSGYLHEIALTIISEFDDAIDVPDEMIEHWENAHIYYVEKAAWIKQMLTL